MLRKRRIAGWKYVQINVFLVDDYDYDYDYDFDYDYDYDMTCDGVVFRACGWNEWSF